jgi:uncharacterized membrane protein
MDNNYKVDKELIKGDIIPILLIVALFIAGIILYPHLPNKVPSHWNASGQIDTYQSRTWGAFGMPLMLAGIYLGMLFLPYIDPKRENYPKFKTTYGIIRLALVVVFSIIQISTLIVALGGPKDLIPKLVPITIGALFIVIGNYMPRIKFNWFVGIRTPWTLSNEEVWRGTHRFSGYMFIIAGMLMCLAAFLPSPINIIIALTGVVVSGVFSIVYSYILFRKVNSNKN